MAEAITRVVGLDLSDRSAEACILPLKGGDVERRETLEMTPASMLEFFGTQSPVRVIMEAGTHSPWLSRLLAELGHEVRVGDPRRIKLVTENVRKSDITDPELLARLDRVDDLELVRPVEHRDEQMQADLSVVKARDQLVKARTALINFARGTVKSLGGRLPSCSTQPSPRRRKCGRRSLYFYRSRANSPSYYTDSGAAVTSMSRCSTPIVSRSTWSRATRKTE